MWPFQVDPLEMAPDPPQVCISSKQNWCFIRMTCPIKSFLNIPFGELFYSTCSMIFLGIVASKHCMNETVTAKQDKPAIVIFSRAHGPIIDYKVTYLVQIDR